MRGIILRAKKAESEYIFGQTAASISATGSIASSRGTASTSGATAGYLRITKVYEGMWKNN